MASLKKINLYKIETTDPFYDLGPSIYAKKAQYQHRGRKKKIDPYEKMKNYWSGIDGGKRK